jgi:phosphoglycolate phosphatase-like HAD superfamily hydrolase
LLLALAGCSGRSEAQQPADPGDSCASALPAWREGPVRRAICDFVARATDVNGRDHVPVEDRIATFDNDGTLWPEQPVIQGAFVLARLQTLAKQDPALAERQPFKAALAGDTKTLMAAGEPALIQLFATTSANMTDDQFVAEARRFFATARHPKLGVPYTALAYQPMVELLDYLRAHGFKTYLSSGGGADFMRVVSQRMYGIPPEQVIGSRPKKQLRRAGGAAVLFRIPEVAAINDKEAKPVNIDAQIGKRPVLAAGNVRSGGDIAMLEYSEGGPVLGRRRPSLQLLINHDDADREFAYGEKDDASLAAARARGWQVVSMKRDWRIVFRPPPGNM